MISLVHVLFLSLVFFVAVDWRISAWLPFVRQWNIFLLLIVFHINFLRRSHHWFSHIDFCVVCLVLYLFLLFLLHAKWYKLRPSPTTLMILLCSPFTLLTIKWMLLFVFFYCCRRSPINIEMRKQIWLHSGSSPKVQGLYTKLTHNHKHRRSKKRIFNVRLFVALFSYLYVYI